MWAPDNEEQDSGDSNEENENPYDTTSPAEESRDPTPTMEARVLKRYKTKCTFYGSLQGDVTCTDICNHKKHHSHLNDHAQHACQPRHQRWEGMSNLERQEAFPHRKRSIEVEDVLHCRECNGTESGYGCFYEDSDDEEIKEWLAKPYYVKCPTCSDEGILDSLSNCCEICSSRGMQETLR